MTTTSTNTSTTPPWGDADTAAAGLLFRHQGVVRPEWIDYNGHMNVAYYLLAFDLADDDGLYTSLNLTPAFRAQSQMSTMTAESHIRYLAEVGEGEAYCVYSQIVDYDDKRWHEIQYMVRGEAPLGVDQFARAPHQVAKGALVATHESLALSVNLDTRRVTPWHSDTRSRLDAAWAAQSQIGAPDWLGQAMGIPPGKSRAR